MDDFQPVPISSLLRVTHRHDGTIIQPNVDEINLMHWNVNHLTNKLEDVELYVASFPGILHIIAISETWLTMYNYLVFQLLGYTAFHNVRSTNGGGISIFVHNSLCEPTPEVTVNLTTSELHHFLVVKITAIDANIAVSYNRPNGNTTAFLTDLQRLCLDLPNCVVMGDFNMDVLVSKNHETVLDTLEMCGFGLLNSVVREATTRSESGTILDLVATNMLSHKYKVSIVHNDISDHAIVYTSMNRRKSRSIVRSTAKMKFDESAAVRMVTTLCQTNSVDWDGNELNTALESIVRTCTSTINIKSDHRINKRHVNREIILAVRNRSRLFALMGLYPLNDAIKIQFDETVRFIKLKNFELKSAFEAGRIEESAGDDRKTWRLYKEIIFNRFERGKETPIMMNDVPISDSVQSCNAVNEHFCSAGERLATEIISIHGYDVNDIANLYPEQTGNNWCFNEVQPEEVIDAIDSLPIKKSTGIDKVPIGLLKATSLIIAPIIALCINLAIQTTVFPAELLKGRLKLIHKCGNFDIENFRGLTLLPSLSKIFEFLFAKQIIDYLNGFNFFNGNQFGFIRHSSCLSAAYQLVDFIRANYRKKFVGVIFIDLKRAFDTVDPLRLSLKLKRIGLSDKAADLMMSYLCNRSTATTIKGNSSNFRSISVGVAQGSKMGPLHFIIYIADMLTLGWLGKMVLYADDTALYYACDTAEELERVMQADSTALHKWLCRNVLTMNIGKTCYMTFGKSRLLPDFNIKINDEVIKRVTTFKYLGLVLDDNLTFNQHIEHVKRMIRPFIPLMWRKGKYIPVVKRKQIYFAYVQSHIVYMLPIYSVGCKTKLRQLQRIQNRCIKAVYRLPRFTPTTYLYTASVLPIEELAIVERVTYLHKVLKSLTKNNFNVQLNHEVHSHRTRQANDVHCPNEHPLLKQSTVEYNRFCKDLSHLVCMKTFKSKLKLEVMKRSEYNVISPYVFLN